MNTLEQVAIPDAAPLAESIPLPYLERPWTADDLLALAGNEPCYELVQGELIVMSSASPVQGSFAMRLSAAIYAHVEANDLGDVYVSEPGFILQAEPLTIRAPDVAFVRKERIPGEEEQEGFWTVAPDPIVEIISPSETARGVEAKVQDYLLEVAVPFAKLCCVPTSQTD